MEVNTPYSVPAHKSLEVHEYVRRVLPLDFEDFGQQQLRNIPDRAARPHANKDFGAERPSCFRSSSRAPFPSHMRCCNIGGHCSTDGMPLLFPFPMHQDPPLIKSVNAQE
jgi:hypothetical protein